MATTPVRTPGAASEGVVRRLPAGPAAPAMVQSLRYYRDPYGYLRACHRKYGDAFTIKLVPCGTLVCLVEPGAVRAIFDEAGGHLVGPVQAFFEPVLGQGLPLTDGVVHARARRWIEPTLTSERMQPMMAEIARLTGEEVATWPRGEAFALQPRLDGLALRILLRAVFGADAWDRVARLEPLILKLKRKDLVQSIIAALPFGLSRWRLSGESARTAAAIDRVIFDEIAARRAATSASAGAGVLARLLAGHPDDGPPSTERQVRDEVLTLIFAGHEYVSATLAWTFERTLRHPAVLAALREAAAREEDTYLSATLLEVMRHRPPTAEVVRQLGSPMVFDGYVLPVGTRVSAAISVLHMREELYPEAEVFRPERFLDGAPVDVGLYLPFGGGAHRCVGEAFAMGQLRTILATVTREAALVAVDPAPERGVSNGVTIGPHLGARVIRR